MLFFFFWQQHAIGIIHEYVNSRDVSRPLGHNYLVVVDRYSAWPMVYHITTGGSITLVKKLREIFVTFGIPEEFASDGGPELVP